MKYFFYSAVMLLAVTIFSCSDKKEDYSWAKDVIGVSAYQLKDLAATCADSAKLPRSVKNDKVRMEDLYDWTSGFFPGSLWYEYELSGDEDIKKEAEKYTSLLYDLKDYKGTHDIGFMMYCSYGNAYRITKNDSIPPILVETANSLISRFNDTTKTIRSWDFGEWSYPVIIDNMMNLELLFWASKFSGDPKYKDIAIIHANTTLKHHYRDDMSSYHVVSYDLNTGEVESQGTFQGYADSSAWARGQSWGLYGYIVCYRETGNVIYLEAAEKIAALLMNHPNMPQDKVPYWDFNAPDIPNAPRDASAAAVMSSALFELSTMAKDGSAYFNYAEDILKSLSSDAYRAKKGTNHGFILMHSVGHLPANSEIDTPINYADYYYLEALKRYLDLKKVNYPMK